MVVSNEQANAKVKELAKRLLNEDIVDSLDVLAALAEGRLEMFTNV